MLPDFRVSLGFNYPVLLTVMNTLLYLFFPPLRTHGAVIMSSTPAEFVAYLGLDRKYQNYYLFSEPSDFINILPTYKPIVFDPHTVTSR